MNIDHLLTLTLDQVFDILEKENWYTNEEINYLKDNAAQVDTSLLRLNSEYINVELFSKDYKVRLLNFHIDLLDFSLEFRDDCFW